MSGAVKKALLGKSSKVAPASTTVKAKQVSGGTADKKKKSAPHKAGTAKVNPSPTKSKSKDSTGTSSTSKLSETKPAVKKAEPVVNPYLGVNGEVTICYNHYKNKFIITDGSTTAAVVDEEYYLTFAFPNSKLHLSTYGPSDFSFEEQGMLCLRFCSIGVL